MYALAIVFEDIMLWNIICPGYRSPFPVTLSAQKGDIHFIGTGSRIGIMVDVMVTMTLLAAGGVWVIFQKSLAMNPPDIINHLVVVTASAFNRIKSASIHVGKIIVVCIRVTGDTGVISVHGF